MIGSFLTRGLVMVFGYAYPAYECYKHVEMNKPDIEQLRFWCQYWILVAILTVCERIGDPFVSWVPMYSEAKLAFFIYLWYPKTKGTTYVYDSFFRPYVAKHETEIDRNLLELRTRAGNIAVLYWQRAWSYGQTRIFDILQYVAARSTPQPRPVQPPQARQQVASARQPQLPNRQPTTTTPMETEDLPSSSTSTSSVQPQKEVAEESGPQVTRPAPRRSNSEKVVAASEILSQSTVTEIVSKGTESLPHSVDGNMSHPEKETVMEEEPKEPVRTTRARSRKSRSAETTKE